MKYNTSKGADMYNRLLPIGCNDLSVPYFNKKLLNCQKKNPFYLINEYFYHNLQIEELIQLK